MKKPTDSGQVFSLISMLMTVVFVMLFSTLTHVALNNQTEIEAAHVERINELVDDLDNLVLMTVDHSTYRMLNFSTAYVRNDGYFTNYTQAFQDCFISGQFEEAGVITNCSYSAENISFPAKLNILFSTIANYYNISLNHSFITANYEQNQPYRLDVDFTVLVDVQGENFAWRRFINLSREVSFIGLTDPLTIGKSYEQQILVAPRNGELITTASFAGGPTDPFDSLLLQEVINNSYYFKDRTGFTLAERFENHSIQANIFIERTSVGISSFLPPDLGLGDTEFNQSTKVLHYYTPRRLLFEEDELVRFNTNLVTGYDKDFILPRQYATQIINLKPGNFSEVEGCCIATGCDSSCT